MAGIVSLAVVGAQASRQSTHRRAERDATAALARATASIAAATQTAVDAVDTVAGRSTTTGGPGSITGLAVDARGDGVSSVMWVPRPEATAVPTQNPAVLATFDAARDQAQLRLSAPFVDHGRRVVAAVRAVYRQGDALTVDGGFGASGQRRERVAGWVVGLIPTTPLLRAADDDVAASITAHDGSTALGRADGRRGAFVNATSLPIAGRVWTLRAYEGATPGAESPFWVAGALGLLLATIIAASVRWGSIRSDRRDAELEGLRNQLAMIADVAPVVQHTLDLGAVLPAAAVRLTDRLALAGISFTFVDDHGRHTEVFAYGAATDAEQAPVLALPDGVPAWSSLALSLQRGGRLGGVVRARTTRALSATECAGLGAVAEMINSALMTARIFEQQAEAVKRLSDVDALKSTFLETASHELRTPVTAIAGFARLAHEQWDELPEEQRHLFVDRIWANASVLDNLVADLLNFSRMERGSLQSHNEPVALSDVLPDVISRLSPVFDSHRITSAIAPDLVVTGEQRSIEQVVTNLLSNAVKFSPTDSEVFVRLVNHNDRAVLTVDDEGPGVPEAERERIFSRFFRGRGPAVIRTRGAGIGLSVVKALAEQMGATVDVGESPAGGARFTVTFPLAPTDPDVAHREDSHVAQS